MWTLGNLWFIPSHYLEAVDNYNKEKVVTTNKITPTTGINETAKMPPLKLFLYFIIRDNVYYIYMYIYKLTLNTNGPRFARFEISLLLKKFLVE